MWAKDALTLLRTQIQRSHRPLNCVSPRTVSSRSSNNAPPQSILVEKYLEEPVIVVSENDDVDIIGPPDSISNLRPIIRKQLLSATSLQRNLREMQNATQQWNQQWWTTHNTNFVKQRKEYIKQRQALEGEERQLTAEEMSAFYKAFLDKNWQNHLNYNVEWYKRNFALLFLAFRVSLEKMVMKFS